MNTSPSNIQIPFFPTRNAMSPACLAEGTQIIPFAVRWYTGEANPEEEDEAIPTTDLGDLGPSEVARYSIDIP